MKSPKFFRQWVSRLLFAKLFYRQTFLLYGILMSKFVNQYKTYSIIKETGFKADYRTVQNLTVENIDEFPVIHQYSPCQNFPF